MIAYPYRGLFTLAACLMLISGVMGCSIVAVSDTAHYSDGEGRLPEDIFSQIQPGVTSKNWIESHFGKPQHIQQTEAGDIYSYQFTRVHRQSTSFLFVARYRGVDQTREYFHVAFEDDLVESHWLDQLPLAQLKPAN